MWVWIDFATVHIPSIVVARVTLVVPGKGGVRAANDGADAVKK